MSNIAYFVWKEGTPFRTAWRYKRQSDAEDTARDLCAHDQSFATYHVLRLPVDWSDLLTTGKLVGALTTGKLVDAHDAMIVLLIKAMLK